MLSIRSANRTDVTLLETLIQEMAEYEKLPNFITEEALARDGFGSQPAFGALIAELDGQPAGYAFFFYCYSTFTGRGLFLEDLFRSIAVSVTTGWGTRCFRVSLRLRVPRTVSESC